MRTMRSARSRAWTQPPSPSRWPSSVTTSSRRRAATGPPPSATGSAEPPSKEFPVAQDLALTGPAVNSVAGSGMTYLPSAPLRTLVTNPDRAGVLRDCRIAHAQVQPASPKAFAVAYERLAVHYPESRLTEGEEKVVKRDWLR